MKEKLYSRKGVTIAEVVIALVIIAVISAFTLSLIVMSFGVENKSEISIEVKNAAENAIECYRFANGDKGKFWECLSKTDDDYAFGQIGFEDESFIPTDKLEHAPLAQLVTNGCTVTITWKANCFSFLAVSAEGKEIYHFDFPEGGAS